MDLACFVFLDETCASTNMVRRYGWEPRSERLADAALHGHWRPPPSSSVSAAQASSRPSCWTGRWLARPFHAYVEQFFASALKASDVVVMDNLAAHKAARVQEAIEAPPPQR
jgi:DDE superfamily endonuclease